MFLPYSHYQSYKQCPKQYKLLYIDKKKPEKPDSSFNAIYGIVIQKVMELLFNEKKYLLGSECSAWMETFIREYYPKLLSEIYVDWETANKTKEEVLDLCLGTVPKLISLLKKNPRLVTSSAKSEVDMKFEVSDNDYITGRIDFVIPQDTEEGEIWILDGKGSDSMKYLKIEQLYYYALVYYRVHGKMPDKIGYIMWKKSSVEFQDFSYNDIIELEKDIKDVFTDIKNKRFVATPSDSACRFCKYKGECDETYKSTYKKIDKSNRPVLIGDDINLVGF